MKDRSYLVQRLEKPWRAPEGGPLAALGDNPFSFGGGLCNGGLSKEAMTLTRDLWGYDYMGSAEYEFGAVPEALRTIAGQADEGALLAGHFEILLSQVRPDFRDKSTPPRGTKARVYVLGRADWTEEIEERIRLMAKDGYGYRVKEPVMIERTLRPYADPRDPDYIERTVGWLELDNGFMFFTDEQMWRGACTLFGVTVTAWTRANSDDLSRMATGASAEPEAGR